MQKHPIKYFLSLPVQLRLDNFLQNVLGVTKTDLAKQLKVSSALINQVISGDSKSDPVKKSILKKINAVDGVKITFNQLWGE